jgi:hypothetical protein
LFPGIFQSLHSRYRAFVTTLGLWFPGLSYFNLGFDVADHGLTLAAVFYLQLFAVTHGVNSTVSFYSVRSLILPLHRN